MQLAQRRSHKIVLRRLVFLHYRKNVEIVTQAVRTASNSGCLLPISVRR